MTPPNPAPVSRVRSALTPLREEFTTNVRVRFGVWCVLAMVFLYWILVRSDDLRAARAEYAGEIARLERAQDARADEDWPLLLEVEQRTGAELTANFWQAETEGVAQARLLAALTELAGETELRDARVQPGVDASRRGRARCLAGAGASHRPPSHWRRTAAAPRLRDPPQEARGRSPGHQPVPSPHQHPRVRLLRRSCAGSHIAHRAIPSECAAAISIPNFRAGTASGSPSRGQAAST